MAGNILDNHRSQLTPKMVETLALVKDWELAHVRMQNTVEQANAELVEGWSGKT